MKGSNRIKESILGFYEQNIDVQFLSINADVFTEEEHHKPINQMHRDTKVLRIFTKKRKTTELLKLKQLAT